MLPVDLQATCPRCKKRFKPEVVRVRFTDDSELVSEEVVDVNDLPDQYHVDLMELVQVDAIDEREGMLDGVDTLFTKTRYSPYCSKDCHDQTWKINSAEYPV